MRLPRRVPWASVGELEQVCGWIYNDRHDVDAHRAALARLAAWRAVTALPHALESAAALLTVIVQDEATAVGSLALRHAYAAALIRLVNGLVDPLQSGVYARSIAAIAAQIGLPAWLVELRHAATHEDLPSLELLRDGANQSMRWLLDNYFLPAITPAPPADAGPALRPLAPTLRQYRTASKTVARDASLRIHQRPVLANSLRDVERWLAEAAVAAAARDWSTDPAARTRWALDQLCDALLDPGALVPLAKKKRTHEGDAFAPPSLSVAVWRDLLAHVQTLHPSFYAVAALRCTQRISASSNEDPSYDACLARWAAWFVASAADGQADDDDDVKADVVASLLAGLGPTSDRQNPAAAELLRVICDSDPELATVPAMLQKEDNDATTGSLEWTADQAAVMEERLAALLADESSPASSPTEDADMLPPEEEQEPSPAPGWRRANPARWHPAPIGVYVAAC
ncbi:Las1-like-domain-containing protein [Schizophyllum amplum]|uniref:Las1-like-domain-containing protein n=1 Tax=Schizophyllum amplum TaxID=97359 RepID=A0A550C5T3_9AGAR|nr:Las1-like-domain-containing protein [Auriculariopsis ampla]